MNTRPTEQLTREVKSNGLFGRTITKCSYAVTLCRIGGADVMAVRMEYFQNKEEVHKAVSEGHPGWKIKTINRLYEEDFVE